jgi:hypothetical protein
MPKTLPRLGVVICLLVAAATAQALILVGGTNPVQDHNWPLGSVAVANLPSRVGFWEGPPFGGGQYVFLYRGDTSAFNAALEALAKVQAPAPGVRLIVEDGPEYDEMLKHSDDDAKGENTRVDWRFEVWVPSCWYRLFNNPQSFFDADHPNFRRPLPPPTMTAYIGGCGGGGIDWTKVQIPKNITVIDHRAATAGITPIGGAMVRGTAYDMVTSKPIPGAHAVLSSLVAQDKWKDVIGADADAQGHFQIEKVPEGVYRLVISAKGYAPREINYQRYKATTFHQCDVILAPSATISGTVVDEAGKPIADVKVRADSVMAIDGFGYELPESVQSKSDANGRFELTGLPLGYTALMCFAPGHYYGMINLLTKTPAKEVKLEMVSTGAIKVSLVDAQGKPSPGNISVDADVKTPEDEMGTWGGGAEVGADGTRLFEDVPPGRYVVSIGHAFPGQPRPAEAKVITVTAGKTTEVTISKPR